MHQQTAGPSRGESPPFMRTGVIQALLGISAGIAILAWPLAYVMGRLQSMMQPDHVAHIFESFGRISFIGSMGVMTTLGSGLLLFVGWKQLSSLWKAVALLPAAGLFTLFFLMVIGVVPNPIELFQSLMRESMRNRTITISVLNESETEYLNATIELDPGNYVVVGPIGPGDDELSSLRSRSRLDELTIEYSFNDGEKSKKAFPLSEPNLGVMEDFEIEIELKAGEGASPPEIFRFEESSPGTIIRVPVESGE